MLNFGSCNLFYLQHIYSDYTLLIVFILVFIASITKSAQIPFSAWLPAAIAAPTPVSSLVHSSTLVTAGVYLIIRFHNVLEYNYLLFIISCLTIFISGLGANFENDLKKVIALSTLSQLGVMIMILSIGQVELAFFHLLAHALFKSLLFLCAGFYIHSSSDTQDFRISGAVTLFSPIISTFFFCASISLCGFPFITGFYSKDLILEMTYINNLNSCFMLLLVVSTILTLLYSLRLFFFLFLYGYHLPISSIVDDSIMYFPITTPPS
jgi:NADH-ubiquinone oxidoreductase chain 5